MNQQSYFTNYQQQSPFNNYQQQSQFNNYQQQPQLNDYPVDSLRNEYVLTELCTLKNTSASAYDKLIKREKSQHKKFDFSFFY
jgi:hypothetical protein